MVSWALPPPACSFRAYLRSCYFRLCLQLPRYRFTFLPPACHKLSFTPLSPSLFRRSENFVARRQTYTIWYRLATKIAALSNRSANVGGGSVQLGSRGALVERARPVAFASGVTGYGADQPSRNPSPFFFSIKVLLSWLLYCYVFVCFIFTNR